MDQPIKLKPSEQVHSATYDPQAQRLTLGLNGGTFAYHGVEQQVADDFAKADSHGQFFHQVIRGNKKYEHTRVR